MLKFILCVYFNDFMNKKVKYQNIWQEFDSFYDFDSRKVDNSS